MKTSGWIALIVVAIIAIGGWFTPVGQAMFGAIANSTNFGDLGAQTLKIGTSCGDSSTWTACQGVSVGASGTFTQGGGIDSTTTPASVTIASTEFDTENGIEMLLSVGAVTVTLPASTTFPLGTQPGSMRQFTLFNATTTAGANITIAGGTGTLLEVASSTNAANAQPIIYSSGVGIFTAFRKANSDIEVFLNPGQ